MKEQGRGKTVALIGVGLQAALTLMVVIFWQTSGARSLLAGLWMMLGGVALWAMTALLFYARQLAEQERLEADELGRDESTIFDQQDQLELRPARRRAEMLTRWVVPIFTLLFAAYHTAMAVLMLQYFARNPALGVEAAGTASLFIFIAALAAFFFSRYGTGMSEQGQWRILRAPSSYLLVCTIFLLLMFASLLLISQGYPQLESVVVYLLPIIEILFAVELAVNFVLNLYRPRIPGEVYTPAYDSRLFNLLAQPGRLGQSIADTLNYQFGFEVSKTWFYQLASKAVVPLIVFALAVMFALSSVVIVGEGEECIIKHWGRVDPNRPLLAPGMHLKWPWPIDTIQRFETGRIHEMVLGVGEKTQPKYTKDGREMMLWSETHGYGNRVEKQFLVASPPRKETDAPSVSLVNLVVVLQYKIDRPLKFAYNYVNSESLLRSVAGQEITEYAARATLIERTGRTNGPQGLMTYGKEQAVKELRERIQKRIGRDGLDMGVEIVFLGIVSAHPPQEAIGKYEEVLQAERQQDQQRYKAQGEANTILAEVAGDPHTALMFYLALYESQIFRELQYLADEPEERETYLQTVITQVRGEIEKLRTEIARGRLLGRSDEQLATPLALKERYEQLLATLEQFRQGPDSVDLDEQLAGATRNRDDLAGRLQGQYADLLASAGAYRWEKELLAWGNLEVFRSRLLPYRTAPKVYLFDLYSDMLDEYLPGLFKYVVGVDPDKLEIRMNLEEEQGVLQGALPGQAEQED